MIYKFNFIYYIFINNIKENNIFTDQTIFENL